MLKENKGITLVALVITIIVLLILAGVSISLVVGDNGVLTQSKKSSDSTKLGQMQEALQIAISDIQTAFVGNYAVNASVTFDSMVNTTTLYNALKNQGYDLLDSAKKVYTTEGTTQADFNSKLTCYISDGTNKLKVYIEKPTTNSNVLTTTYDENPTLE